MNLFGSSVLACRQCLNRIDVFYCTNTSQKKSKQKWKSCLHLRLRFLVQTCLTSALPGQDRIKPSSHFLVAVMYPRGTIWLKDEFTSCRLSHVMRCTPKWFYMSMSFPFTNETAQNLLPLCLPCVHPISSPLQPAKLCGGYRKSIAIITVISTPTAVTLFLRRKAFCTGTAYPEWENLAKRLGELHVFHNLERQKLNLPPAVYCPRQSWQTYLRPLSRVIVWGCRPEPETTTRTPPVHRSAMDTFSFSSFI